MFKKIMFLILTFFLILFMQHSYSLENLKENNMIDDSVITTKIKAKLLANQSTSALNIKVDTKNGVVMLSGKVKSEEEICKAVELSISTAGTKDVDVSKLELSSSTVASSLNDLIITAKVKGTFLKEKMSKEGPVDFTEIKVETTNGVVYLSGTLESQKMAEIAINIAKSIKGVKKVESSISIRE